ncbi:hypothetical protein SK128_009662, partial [Halocaridina rubra]
ACVCVGGGSVCEAATRDVRVRQLLCLMTPGGRTSGVRQLLCLMTPGGRTNRNYGRVYSKRRG